MFAKAKRDNPQDVYYYKPLHVWAKIGGILPNFDLNDDLTRPTARPCWNGVFMAIVFGCIYCYATYGKLVHLAGVLPPTVFMTDVGGDAALFVVNVASIVRISLVKAKQVRQFLDHMKKIDAELRSIADDVRYPRRVFVLEFVFTNVIFVIYYVYDAYIWIDSVTIHVYKWFILRDIQCFHMIVVSLVVRNYSLAIRNRVRILNETLRRMRPTRDEHASMHARNASERLTFERKRKAHADRTEKEHQKVQRMRRIYARICVSIGIYNDIFGWIYLVMYVAIVTYLLTSCNIALVYGVGNRKVGKAEFGIALVVLCVLWSALSLIVGFFIFSAADKVFFEIKRTPIICYSIIDGWLPFDEEHILVPELERFAQQVTNSHPEITAAGFFAVDYAIFFALLGSLSSYLIVLIQFM